jgi:hypothetical protein
MYYIIRDQFQHHNIQPKTDNTYFEGRDGVLCLQLIDQGRILIREGCLSALRRVEAVCGRVSYFEVRLDSTLGRRANSEDKISRLRCGIMEIYCSTRLSADALTESATTTVPGGLIASMETCSCYKEGQTYQTDCFKDLVCGLN